MLGNTVVAIFSDHGEEFGEHGKFQHSRQLYVESVHVPLILYVDGKHKKIRERVSLVDLYPTVLDLLGLRPKEADPQGISLLHYAKGAEGLDKRVIFSELMVNCEGPVKFKKAIYKGRYKLMWDLDTDEVLLFDVVADPFEKKPIEMPEVQEQLFAILKQFVLSGDHH